MRRASLWMLLAAGLFLLFCGVAHVAVGWRAIRGALQTAGVAHDLVSSIGFGWIYGGAAMFAFGVIVLSVWWWGRTGRFEATRVTSAVSALYLGFGGWAYVTSGLDAFFIGFIVIGVLLAVGSYGLKRRAGA